MISIAEMMRIHEGNGGIFPAGAGETITPMSESATIEAAKTELRKVAMQLHAEARAVLQNVFLCRADVVDALNHLNFARTAIENIFLSPTNIKTINLPNK